MLTVLLHLGVVSGVMVFPTRPPRGWNSFDLQYDSKKNPAIGAWNETSVLFLHASILP